MTKAFFLAVVVVCLSNSKVFGASSWSHDGVNGTSQWAQLFPDCGEPNQSPINISHDTTVVNNSLGVFKHSIFEAPPTSMLIKNNGHALQVDLTGAYIIDDSTLLPGQFKAAQFHFHWAKPNEKGSEHRLDGTHYWGELHIVHYNMKYGSLGNAADKPDGLTVLGFFITDDYPQENTAMQRVIAPVVNNMVNYNGQNMAYTTPFSLESILPNNMTIYYRYKGSLTTPLCYESVVWTVFREPIRISRQQAITFETMLYANVAEQPDVPLYGNFRPIQPLNSRIVTRSSFCSGGESFINRASIRWVIITSLLLSAVSLY